MPTPKLDAIDIYLNQKPETSAINIDDVLTGHITNETNSNGTPKFKKDEEGKRYVVKSEPTTSEWEGSYGKMVTYYLKVEESSSQVNDTAKGAAPKSPEAVRNLFQPSEFEQSKQRAIIRQHSQEMAIRSYSDNEHIQFESEEFKKRVDWFYQDALQAAYGNVEQLLASETTPASKNEKKLADIPF